MIKYSVHLVGPQRRKRTNPNERFPRVGAKSTPQSVMCSDDETSGDETDDLLDVRPNGTGKWRATRPLAVLFEDAVMDTGGNSQSIDPAFTPALPPSPPPTPPPGITPSSSQDTVDSSQSQPWCQPSADLNPSSLVSGLETFVKNFPLRQHVIGKSARDTQDWLSANPRVAQWMSQGSPNNQSTYGGGGLSPIPSLPLSLHSLSRGVFDRYDLTPPSVPHDISSEVGFGDTHLAFSGLSFTHHSNYAGDLILGSPGLAFPKHRSVLRLE